MVHTGGLPPVCNISTAKSFYCSALVSVVFVSAPDGICRSCIHGRTGKIPSTSQHVCRDFFHDNEDHAWHKGHSFQPKTTIPRLPASRAKGVSLSSTRVMACGSMLSFSPSGTGFIAHSLWRSWRLCPVAVLSDWLRFPLESCVFVFQRAQGEKFSPHLFNCK